VKKTELDIEDFDSEPEQDSSKTAVLDYERIREIVQWFAPENIPTSVEEFKKEVLPYLVC
jgi:hypothetical protein